MNSKQTKRKSKALNLNMNPISKKKSMKKGQNTSIFGNDDENDVPLVPFIRKRNKSKKNRSKSKKIKR